MTPTLRTHVPKLAILSHVLPPSASGQAVVLHRLLRDWSRDQYCLLSTKDYQSSARQTATDDATRPLSANYHFLPGEWAVRLLDSPLESFAKRLLAGGRRLFRQLPGRRSLPRQSSPPVVTQSPSNIPEPPRPWTQRCREFMQACEDWLNLRFQVRQRARQIERIIHQEGCDAILACTGDLLDIPAACLAARRCQIPFYVYLFDDYVYQWTRPFQRDFARRMADEFVPHAAGVIVPNQFLGRFWQSRYPVDPCLIHNVVEQPGETVPASSIEAEQSGTWRIVYTGSIYTAHVDAFRNLLTALRDFPAISCTLDVYSASSAAVLDPFDTDERIRWHGPVSAREALALQQKADVLFLPLAFASPYPELVNTSAPGKMGELLASGRPILVHAPAESYVSWYFRTHECGLVVDAPEPRLLADALTRLRTDAALRARLSANARARAQLDFDLAKARERLQELIARGHHAKNFQIQNPRALSA